MSYVSGLSYGFAVPSLEQQRLSDTRRARRRQEMEAAFARIGEARAQGQLTDAEARWAEHELKMERLLPEKLEGRISAVAALLSLGLGARDLYDLRLMVVRGKSWSVQAREWAEWLSGLEDAEASEAGRRALACRGFLQGEAAALYRTVLREQVKVGGPQRRELLTLAARLRGGERLALQCWCYPRPCHAAVIREAVLGYAGRL